MLPSWYGIHAPDSPANQAEQKLAVMAIVHLRDLLSTSRPADGSLPGCWEPHKGELGLVSAFAWASFIDGGGQHSREPSVEDDMVTSCGRGADV